MKPPSSVIAPPRQRAAFTLIELLVAMVVGMLLIIFLFQLFNATVQAWQKGETQNNTYREARAAMQMMVRDLSQTSGPLAGNPYTSSASAAVIAPTLVIDRYPGATPEPKDGDEINEEVYCLTTISNNGASSLCAVGYFCSWMPDLIAGDDLQAAQKLARAPRSFALMRQFLGSGRPATGDDPSTTGTDESRVATPGLFERFKAASGRTPLTFLDVYERARPPLTPTQDPPVAAAAVLSSYIWDLQIRTPKTNQLTTQQLPSPPEYAAAPASAPPFYPKALPPYLEVRFKALSEDAARQLEANTGVDRTTWKNASASNSIYQRIILPGTRQFAARVPIYSGSATTVP